MQKNIIKLVSFFILFCCIIFNSSFAIEPENTVKYQGIDVSSWQGKIDFDSVSRSGIEIVYIKASQGDSYVDPYFERNYNEAKSNNLKIGFYHFVTAKNIEEAKKEAIFFSNLVKDKSIDCKLAMDFEIFGNLNTKEINNIATVFLGTVKEITGMDVIIYSDLYNSTNIFGKELAEKYQVWVAYYGNYNEIKNIPTNWSYWEGIQYMNKGIIPGIFGYVDRDYFTPEIFLDNNVKYEPQNANTYTLEYIVKKGDTLSKIAKMYNTTVKEIADLNKIENVNLIYPNEKLNLIENTYINDKGYHLGHYEYRVKCGDTLSEIAVKYHTTVEKIAELNDIKNINLIYANEILRIKI